MRRSAPKMTKVSWIPYKCRYFCQESFLCTAELSSTLFLQEIPLSIPIWHSERCPTADTKKKFSPFLVRWHTLSHVMLWAAISSHKRYHGYGHSKTKRPSYLQKPFLYHKVPNILFFLFQFSMAKIRNSVQPRPLWLMTNDSLLKKSSVHCKNFCSGQQLFSNWDGKNRER